MKVMIKNVVLITTLFMLSWSDVVSQRLLNPIRTQSLTASPILLIRSGDVSDLKINNIIFPDTVSLGEIVTISAYVQNTGDVYFDGHVNINLGFEAEDGEAVNDPETSEVDDNQALTNLVLQPGESLFFTKQVVLDANKVNPNTNNVVIVWPAFRSASDQIGTDDQLNYSLFPFFTKGLSSDNSQGGAKKSNKQQGNLPWPAAYNQAHLQFNSFFEMRQYIRHHNIELQHGSIYNLSGQSLYNFNNYPFSLDQLNHLKQNKNTFFIVSMRVKNPVKQQHLFVKTNALSW